MEEDGSCLKRKAPIFRDIRKYYCDYCGISRSKKSLINSHILSLHKDEIKETGEEKAKLNTCEQCGASFKKPAHLKQHMQSHSLEYQVGGPPEKLHQVSLSHALFHFERPYSCPVGDCHSSYRRKDHLNRHLLLHEGKLFDCPVNSCKSRFAFQGNMKRHVKEFHDGSSSSEVEGPKQYVCSEIGCGKAFKYASKLRKHEDSHVKLDAVEIFCSEPGCMKCFTNEQCLKAHLRACHSHITCEKCGTKQLKKNIKRHLRTHDADGATFERIKCSYKGCLHTFSTRSNLRQHMKAVHFKQKPFACGISGCAMRFAFRHVRDNHEQSGFHLYTPGDFVEFDEQFRSRPRGGRKRKYPTIIETFMRKRVMHIPPSESDSLLNKCVIMSHGC